MKNTSSKNISDILCFTILLFCILSKSQVNAWGGLFNRFNPSVVSNLGYGGAGGYGKELYSAAHKNSPGNRFEELLDEESKAGPILGGCGGKMCTANEQCCTGHVCVDADETTGTCMPLYGKAPGESCDRDTECEAGFLCIHDGSTKSCQAPVSGDKNLGENCRSSSDCNFNKGLCCKLTRRARSQPKKICSYYVDPANCLGPVGASKVVGTRDFTAGEKRMPAHPDYLHY